MTDQHYFETTQIASNHPGRIQVRTARRRFQDEGRIQKEIEANRRTAAQIRAMIAKLNRDVSSLDDSINADLERARFRDPSHYAYPISVRTMDARRGNLKATIAILMERLAKVDQAANDASIADLRPSVAGAEETLTIRPVRMTG
jgi:hypothetical protein